MPAEVERKLVTILFTDLVGSTEVMQRLGDDRAQAVFQAHHDFLRDTAVAMGGDLLEWTGDGVMAIFPAISDAIRCAIAAQITSPRDADEEVPGVRVGLNVGEVLRHELGSGYFGTPIVIARRLCDQARAGQVICSTAAAGLVAGSRSFEFRELGPLRLKGISEPVAASEVVYRAKPSPRLLPTALEQLVQNLPDVVVATNELGLVTFFNRGAEEALGYSSDEILGRYSAFDLNSPVTLERAGEVREEFPFAPPEHVQQPLIQSVVDELLGRGTCPSTSESAARTSRVLDEIVKP